MAGAARPLSPLARRARAFLTTMVVISLPVLPRPLLANGRYPAAQSLAVDPSDPRRLWLRATYGLLTSGVLTLVEDLRQLPLERTQKLGPAELASIAEQIHRVARELLSAPEWANDLDSSLRLCRAEMESSRGQDAVLDLILADEKLVSAHAGPIQARSFLDRVAGILRSA